MAADTSRRRGFRPSGGGLLALIALLVLGSVALSYRSLPRFFQLSSYQNASGMLIDAATEQQAETDEQQPGSLSPLSISKGGRHPPVINLQVDETTETEQPAKIGETGVRDMAGLDERASEDRWREQLELLNAKGLLPLTARSSRGHVRARQKQLIPVDPHAASRASSLDDMPPVRSIEEHPSAWPGLPAGVLWNDSLIATGGSSHRLRGQAWADAALSNDGLPMHRAVYRAGHYWAVSGRAQRDIRQAARRSAGEHGWPHGIELRPEVGLRHAGDAAGLAAAYAQRDPERMISDIVRSLAGGSLAPGEAARLARSSADRRPNAGWERAAGSKDAGSPDSLGSRFALQQLARTTAGFGPRLRSPRQQLMLRADAGAARASYSRQAPGNPAAHYPKVVSLKHDLSISADDSSASAASRGSPAGAGGGRGGAAAGPPALLGRRAGPARSSGAGEGPERSPAVSSGANVREALWDDGGGSSDDDDALHPNLLVDPSVGAELIRSRLNDTHLHTVSYNRTV